MLPFQHMPKLHHSNGPTKYPGRQSGGLALVAITVTPASRGACLGGKERLAGDAVAVRPQVRGGRHKLHGQRVVLVKLHRRVGR